MSEKAQSGPSSPVKVKKTASSSSQESESSFHLDFDSQIRSETLNRRERVRRSSWDESDDDLSPENVESFELTQLHLSDSQKFKASVAAEINQLKKQFFDSLEKLKHPDYQPFDSATSLAETDDRRQCPARIRRRTKSSSSLSPVLEAKTLDSSEKFSGLDDTFNEVSSKILDFDPKYYLTNFFNELRTKRITLTDPSTTDREKEEEESGWIKQDREFIAIDLDKHENQDHFCKTSRKLSQIIEVEETKKDLEKSSEETAENSCLFSKKLKPKENNSPLQTARSRKEKIMENSTVTQKENFKSLSSEEFGNFQKVQYPYRGSLSERSNKYFRNKPKDNFTLLPVTPPKPNRFTEDKNSKNLNKFVSFDQELNTDKYLSQESNSIKNDNENLDSIDCLQIDLMKNSSSLNPTPRSTDGSELSSTTRSRSVKSRNSNPESPKFKVNIGRDSARSLRVENVNTPDSTKKATGNEIESESKPASFSDRTPKNSRSLSRLNNSPEQKSDRNFQIPLESLSLESVKSVSSCSKELETNSSKSQKSKSTERSQRKKQRTRMNGPCLEIVEPTEFNSLLGSSRIYEKTPNRVGTPMQENHRNLSRRSIKTPNRQSTRSLKSEKTSSPHSTEEKFFSNAFDEEIQTPELDLPLDIPESQKSSYRSVKASDFKNSARSGVKHSSSRSSNRSSSLKSKNTNCTVTPKITSRSNESNSSRSKDSLENFKETENPDFEINSWSELEKINDSSSNSTSTRISSAKNSWRMQNISSQQSPPERGRCKSELDDSDIPQKINSFREQRSGSGKSSRRSKESTHNSSPTKSIKFSPKSTISDEHKIDEEVHPEFEKFFLQVTNETIRTKISSMEENENLEKVQSAQTLSESDRYSEKKLSIINEASFEDLEVSNESNENEEISSEQSQRSSKKEYKELLPQSANRSLKSSARSRKQTMEQPSEELSDFADGKKWNELIEAFSEIPNSSFVSQNTVYNFTHSAKENIYIKADTEENQKTFATITGGKYEIPERYYPFENEIEEEDDFKNRNLDYGEPSFEQPIKGNITPLPNFQKLYYVNVNEQRPFGIGECGDVTNWNMDKSDTAEKPKAYGDGIQLHKPSEVLAILGKKEKEVKVQRNLWTDLKGDFGSSKQKLHRLFTELEDQTDSKRFTPIGLITSKSDNCIIRKNDEEKDIQISTTCELKNKSKSQVSNCEEKTAAKNITELNFSTESLDYEKEIENSEFSCTVARLSKSMIDLNTRLEKESFEDIELNSNSNSAGSQLFERVSATSKGEKESTNLNIFLARNRKEEKATTKLNNWLNFKPLEKEKSHKKNKKVRKKRKDMSSPKEKNQEYLCTGKSRSSIPPLKLRNPNCFQNFYKRIVSVFCLTSHSSAATSK